MPLPVKDMPSSRQQEASSRPHRLEAPRQICIDPYACQYYLSETIVWEA